MGLLDKIFKEKEKTNTKTQDGIDKLEQKEIIPKKDLTELETLKEKERAQQNKLWDKDYYGSEESKIKANEIKKERVEYLQNNPDDFLSRGVYLFGTTWDYVDIISNDERKIFALAGKGLYLENELNQYEEAIEIYKEADELTMIVKKDEIEKLTKEHGERDWLYTGKLRQRIRICEDKIFRDNIKKIEVEAKELEKTNPQEAIKKYEYLNEIKPGLKKYSKRIEIIERTLE